MSSNSVGDTEIEILVQAAEHRERPPGTIYSGSASSSLGGARRRSVAPTGGERFLGADILLANSAEQRMILWVASDLVATAGPVIDSVDSFECERPVTELGMMYAFSIDGELTPALIATRSRVALRTRTMIPLRPVVPGLSHAFGSVGYLPNRLSRCEDAVRRDR